MLKEVCLENTGQLAAALKAGADRIELCDNLAVGGTTVSWASLKYAKRLCQEAGVPLAVLIRPRGGDFVYQDFEKQIILEDAQQATRLGADRLVLGALTSNGFWDADFMATVLKACLDINPKLQLTAHMAFDWIGGGDASEGGRKKRLDSLSLLAQQGFDTVLSHGSPLANPIEENIEQLQAYLEPCTQLGLTLMPGGGLRYDNLDQVLARLGQVQAVHGSRIIDFC